MKTASFRSLIPTLSLSFFFISAGCQDNARDLPTRGKLTMISSEDIFPVIDKEVKEFAPTSKALQDMLLLYWSNDYPLFILITQHGIPVTKSSG